MYPSPGFLTEVTYLFAALDLTEGETHPDEDEFVETVRLPIAEVERLIAEDRLARRKDHRGDVSRTAEKPVLRSVNHELLIV